ncbi:glycoside hydrolase family 88 protein [Phanerochaete sordida]|uniref:Glycoside hydrolase family 88 protein n=1 Tax=Phanerochaete sordida TaxID=48140 RepID=A0A9P3L977_9APHY|nr:glycoside hydrolase family 88 protein [Phanerochaete sordida]
MRTTFVSLFIAALGLARAQELTDAQITTIKNGLDSAQPPLQSWEIGTYAEALLELDTPSWSTLTPGVPFATYTTAAPPGSLDAVLAIARSVVQQWTDANNVTAANAHTISAPLLTNAAAGDPPSTGFAVVLANLTGQGARDGLLYGAAADSQVRWLLTNDSRTGPDGALSHRPDQLQLWDDFVYMVPPFLAHYGVATRNASMLREAYNQIRQYRALLRDAETGLWRHMALGYSCDEGYWATGMGWVTGGIVRVLALIASSHYSAELAAEQADLVQWAHELQSALADHLSDEHLFHNYVDDASTFLDAASSALFAAFAYRLDVLLRARTLPLPGSLVTPPAVLAAAERVRKELFTAPSATTGSGLAHFTDDMTLQPVTNGHSYPYELLLPPNATNVAANGGIAMSYEAQGFVLNLQAAYRDWRAVGNFAKSGRGMW